MEKMKDHGYSLASAPLAGFLSRSRERARRAVVESKDDAE